MRTLRAPLLLLSGLLAAGCGGRSPNGSPDAGRAAAPSPPAPRGERTPIDPGVVRADVEGHDDFGSPRKAACPRRIEDRHEERRRYPAIDVLEGLGYVTISDDTSRGAYEKVVELTDTGRRELGGDLEEDAERYVVTVARREYLAGSERFENAPNRTDRVVVSFRWRWKGTNALGERLDTSAPFSTRPEHQGRATYDRAGDGWALRELWLDRDGRDYTRGV